MCPVCIASSAAMIAGAGSTGGILAVCLLKFRKAFKLTRSLTFQKNDRNNDEELCFRDWEAAQQQFPAKETTR
jgi:hypothetical protein